MGPTPSYTTSWDTIEFLSMDVITSARVAVSKYHRIDSSNSISGFEACSFAGYKLLK